MERHPTGSATEEVQERRRLHPSRLAVMPAGAEDVRERRRLHPSCLAVMPAGAEEVRERRRLHPSRLAVMPAGTEEVRERRRLYPSCLAVMPAGTEEVRERRRLHPSCVVVMPAARPEVRERSRVHPSCLVIMPAGGAEVRERCHLHPSRLASCWGRGGGAASSSSPAGRSFSTAGGESLPSVSGGLPGAGRATVSSEDGALTFAFGDVSGADGAMLSSDRAAGAGAAAGTAWHDWHVGPSGGESAAATAGSWEEPSSSAPEEKLDTGPSPQRHGAAGAAPPAARAAKGRRNVRFTSPAGETEPAERLEAEQAPEPRAQQGLLPGGGAAAGRYGRLMG